MADENLLKRVHNLSDLELAALLSLISREHCLISTLPDAVDELVEELQLISSRTFGLKCVVVDCTRQTTLDDFATALLLPHSPPAPRSASPYLSRNDSYFPPQSAGISASHRGPYSPLTSASTPGGGQAVQMANVVLARHLDRAPKAVQIQALELLRTRRIFTRTAVQTAPKQFLFVAVLGATSGGEARVTAHLNDFFYISHWHDPEDGFANLDEEWGRGGEKGLTEDDGASTTSTESVVKKSSSGAGEAVFSECDIVGLAQLAQQVQVDIDVLRYQMNIVSFLRMHRAVAGGVTPTATKHFEQLMRCLAPLHGLDYVTPSLVALAARKVYLHRIWIVAPEKERSMQWGSELSAIEALLEGVGPEDVVEDVLDLVAAPL